MHDIVVIGGGPAGCKAATLLAEDHDVIVIEDHAVSGSPVQCTGLITDRVVDMSGVKPIILNRLYGANVHFPGGGIISASSQKAKAVLIDRGDLDRKMAEKAMGRGAEFLYSSRYGGHTVKDGIVSASVGDSVIESKMIVGADGHTSAVSASLNGNLPREYVRGIQYDVRHESEDQGMIDIRIGSDVAPGFFSWEIPFGEFTRVGLCCSWNSGLPSDHMKILMKKSGLDGCEVVARYSGKIPLGGRRRTYGDNLMLIGDAAGQVKPISGGGLYPAFLSAPCLSKTADEAYSSNDFSSRRLSSYEKRWKKEVGKELKRGYLLRKMYTNMSDADLDKVYSVIDRDDVRSILDDIDVDSPSSMAPAVMKNIPVALRLMPLALKALVG